MARLRFKYSCALLLLLSAFCLLPSLFADEYRAYWVDTFHTPLGTHKDIDRVIDVAVQSHANALFVEVRRRGDSWYLDSKEPLTEVEGAGEPDANGQWTFDPLAYLITQAHAQQIQVHAFVIIGAVFRGDPLIALPKDPKHVFLQHIWDAANNKPYSGPQQWATRSIAPNLRGTSYGGQRHGEDWYIDLGHPEAATYTIDVLLHLLNKYDVDGVHLDRVRYPESPTDRSGGANIGYNAVSVARFKARYGDQAKLDADGNPRSNDALWNQWRRDQVTQFVRRFYLHATAMKPSIIVSAALVAWASGPRASGGFHETDAYSHVFQDWDAWLREGIIDVASPMLYKREHVARERTQFDDWLKFTTATAHENDRIAVAGIGAYMNGVEGTLRQGRRARDAGADGILMFAVGDTAPWTTADNSTNTAVRKNPYSLSAPGKFTPKRPNEDFAAAIASKNGRFERASHPLFAQNTSPPAKRPAMTGSLMGYTHQDGASIAIDSDTVHRTTTTDGSGFYGILGLPPGEYHIEGCAVQIVADRVSRLDLPCK